MNPIGAVLILACDPENVLHPTAILQIGELLRRNVSLESFCEALVAIFFIRVLEHVTRMTSRWL